MVVIAILGVLAAIAIPKFTDSTAAANTAMTAANTTNGDIVLFTYNSKVYATIEKGATAGFTDGTDFIVEITGVTGTVTVADFIA